MILAFSTQINSKPTYFVEKINRGLLINQIHKDFEFDCDKYPIDLFNLNKYEPKIHTIREDKTDRWKAGMKIDFFINVRTKDMFRFAPVLPVVSVQNFEVEKLCDTGEWYKDFIVLVDNVYQEVDEIKQIAQNDGFDTVEDFFEYFNKDFKGKIIHWTDKKY